MHLFATVRTTDHSVVFASVSFLSLLRLSSERAMFVFSSPSLPFTKNFFLKMESIILYLYDSSLQLP